MHKNNLRTSLVPLTLAALLAPAGIVTILLIGARTGAAEAQLVERGTFAKPIHRPAPRYPQRELDRRRQGWVLVNYVVSKEGEVIDPVVEDSSGSPLFEKEALQVVQRWKYEPATWDGNPVEQSHAPVLVTFAMEEDIDPGVSRKFLSQWKKIVDSIEHGAIEKARSRLDKLWQKDDLSVYEIAELSALEWLFARKQGDVDRELRLLRRATIGDGRWLSRERYVYLLLARTELEIRLLEFSAALNSWERLVQINGGERDLSQLQAYVNRINDAIASNQVITITGRLDVADNCIDCRPTWFYRPLRRLFEFRDIRGRLDSLRIQCDWHRSRSVPQEGKVWQIPEDWGSCRLIVTGASGTYFKFRELPE